MIPPWFVANGTMFKAAPLETFPTDDGASITTCLKSVCGMKNGVGHFYRSSECWDKLWEVRHFESWWTIVFDLLSTKKESQAYIPWKR